jgi:phage-related holin
MTTVKMKLILSAILSPILMFFEPYTILVQAIGLLVVIDILTGMFAARKEGKDLTSKSLWNKVPRVGLFLCALSAAKISSPLLLEFGIAEHQAGKWLCALYGAYELFSILENLGRLGLPVAKQMAELLKSKLPEDIKKATEEIKASE